MWEDGSQRHYEHWRSDQPNAYYGKSEPGVDYCAIVDKDETNDWTWLDTLCSLEYRYVCANPNILEPEGKNNSITVGFYTGIIVLTGPYSG